MKIKYELEDGAHVPTRAHSTDAGFDLYAMKDEIVSFGSPAIVKTGVHMLIPHGYVGLICPRSGLTQKGIVAEIGVVDAGFTGELQVTVRLEKCRLDASGRLLPHLEMISKGTRVAQVVVMPIADLELEPGNVSGEITERGSNGYGSTGL